MAEHPPNDGVPAPPWGYTQGSSLINDAPRATTTTTAKSISSRGSDPPGYHPEPSFNSPPIPFPLARMPPLATTVSLPSSAHTFFPRLESYGDTPQQSNPPASETHNGNRVPGTPQQEPPHPREPVLVQTVVTTPEECASAPLRSQQHHHNNNTQHSHLTPNSGNALIERTVSSQRSLGSRSSRRSRGDPNESHASSYHPEASMVDDPNSPHALIPTDNQECLNNNKNV